MRGVFRTAGHGADCRLLFYADTPEEVFRLAARAVAASGRHGDAAPEPQSGERVVLEATDLATLLADWVNELIARSEIAGRPIECKAVQLDSYPTAFRLTAEVGAARGSWRPHLKAATFHNLVFERRGRRWHAAVVCDL